MYYEDKHRKFNSSMWMSKLSGQIEMTSELINPFKALSYDVASKIFDILQTHDRVTVSDIGKTRKVYYSNLLRLKKSGLITKRKGKYKVTSLGRVVFKSKSLITQAVEDRWMLAALDSIKRDSNSEKVMAHAAELLIKNAELRDLVLQK